MECQCFDLPLLLKAVDDILVAPSNLMRQTLQTNLASTRCSCQPHHLPYLDGAVFPTRLQPQYPEGLGNHHSLLAVVWWGHTLEELQTLERGSTPRSFVGYHSADGAKEDFGGSAMVERAGLLGIDNVALVEKVVVAELHGAKRRLDLLRGWYNIIIPCCGRNSQRC